MILRLGGFGDKKVYRDDAGLLYHTTITMDHNNQISGGAAYIDQPLPGESGTSNFDLEGNMYSVTGTIAIAPASGGSLYLSFAPDASGAATIAVASTTVSAGPGGAPGFRVTK